MGELEDGSKVIVRNTCSEHGASTLEIQIAGNYIKFRYR